MIIKNSLVCDSFQSRKVDIRIENGIITELGENLTSNNLDEIFDATNMITMPYLFDMNNFINSISIESIRKHSKKSIKGGVLGTVLNPNILTPIDNEMIIEFIKTKNEQIESEIIIVCNAIDSDGKLNSISTLIKTGAKAVYIESSYDINIIRRVFEYAKMLDIFVICKAYNKKLAQDGVINDGQLASDLGVPAIIDSSEFVDIATISHLADDIDVKVIFQTISTKQSIKILDSINNSNLKREVSINHLMLNENSCKDFNSFGKNLPPLKSDEVRKDFVEMLKNDKFDILTSGSVEFSYSSKDKPFSEASFGIDNLEFYIPLIYTLSKKENIPLEKLIKLASFNPAKFLGYDYGIIEIGKKANLIILNPDKKVEIKSFSPYFDININSKIIKYIR